MEYKEFDNRAEHTTKQEAGKNVNPIEFSIQHGDIESVQKSPEFQNASEFGKLNIALKTVYNAIDTQSKIFNGLLNLDVPDARLEAEEFRRNKIQPLRDLKNMIVYYGKDVPITSTLDIPEEEQAA